MAHSDLVAAARRILWQLGTVGTAYTRYQPEGGGRYDLAFVRMFSPSPGEEFAGAKLDGSYVLVVWLAQASHAFRLFGESAFDPDYVWGKLGGTPEDARKIAALLEAVQQASEAVWS